MGSTPPNLNINLDKTDLNPNEKEQLTNLIHEFSDIFAEDASQLGRASVIKHHIDTGDHHPVRQNHTEFHLSRRELSLSMLRKWPKTT